MQVSVIIPVYNAEQFVAAAIESALAQPEVAEVLLIEDGSPDNALAICTTFAEREPRVALLRHPNGENLGAGASRNLGIKHASCQFVAFLDADDTYLPGRFAEAQIAFERHPDADGIYEMVGVTYHDKGLRDRHINRIGNEHTGLVKFIHPRHLFRSLATGKFGHIHLNGLVVRREVLSQDLLFDESLIQCQDSDFLFRAASKLQLYNGGTRQVARRGVHPDNRVFDEEKNIAYKRKYLRKCIDQQFYGSMDFRANMYVIMRYILAIKSFQPVANMGRITDALRAGLSLVFIVTHPSVMVTLMKSLIHKSPPVKRIRIDSGQVVR